MTKGFGRGSKELGIPTANFNEEVVAALPNDLETGIYFGWTNLEGDENQKIRKAVISIGWNPFYDNSKKSVVSNLHNSTSLCPYCPVLLPISVAVS